jgi:ABC-type branched-subunit amino acid transport system substrate-binding protein
LVVAALAAALLPACGLRVSSQVVNAATAAATSTGNGGGGGSGSGSGAGSVSGSGTGSGSGAAPGGGSGNAGPSGGSTVGGTTAPGGSSGTGPVGSTDQSGTSPAIGSAAPSGGNGGATAIGVTATSITVGNVSDLGGPVPGLFQGGPYGTQAYFDYVNSQGGVYGRQLKLQTADDGLQCSQNESSYQDLVGKVFAFVGSWSLDDNCGAQVLLQHKDVPALNQTLSAQASAVPGEYNVQPYAAGAGTGPFLYYKSKFPDAITKVGTIVGNQPSAVQSWKYYKATMQSLGYNVIYEDDFPPAQSNFTADVIRMRAAGVKMVFVIAVNAPDLADLSSEAAQQGWKPEVWASGIGYFGSYIQTAGGNSATEGQYVNVGLARFLGEDAATVPEVSLFDTWIKRAFPSFPVDQFAATSWANAALFVHALQMIGPNVTRAALLTALASTHNFDDNGMTAPADVGLKTPTSCYAILQIHSGQYVRVDDPPTGFRCDSTFVPYKG